MSRRDRHHRVYCQGCANLLLIEGVPPQCVATARFVPGPLRSRIDVEGRKPAESRNLYNDCTLRTPVSLRAWELKSWITRRLNDGKDPSEDQLKKSRLEDYPVYSESQRATAYRERNAKVQDKATTQDDEIDISKEQEAGILDDDGDYGDDNADAFGEFGHEDLLDPDDHP